MFTLIMLFLHYYFVGRKMKFSEHENTETSFKIVLIFLIPGVLLDLLLGI